jgi:ABC-type transport system substrate-binding protein
MNTRARWLADRAHRRAISAAIDRNLAVRVLADGAGTLAHGLQPGDEHALPDSAWSPNPSEAGALPALKPPPAGLAFWVPQGSDLGVRVAEFVQVALARHGVRVHIERAPWDEFMRAVDDGRADLFYLSWFADSYDRVAFVSSLIESSHRGAGGNRTWYSNPQVDAQLLRARSISDPEVKATALADAERIALSDAPLVPLFQGTSIFVERPWVNGFRSNGLGCPRYDTVEVTRGR